MGVANPAVAQDVTLPGLRENPASLDAAEITRIVQGFRISPVPVNIQGKNITLVGLGSYLVNSIGGCGGCHTHPTYLEGGDPFQGQPERINTAEYLTGGR